MNIKKFQFICRFTSVIFKVLAGMFIFIIVVGLYVTLFRANGSLQFEPAGFTFFQFQRNPITDEVLERAALFAVPIFSLIHVYVLLKGSQLFDKLHEGYTPFSPEFVMNLKKISYIMIVFDAVTPIIYSGLVTLLAEDASYFFFSLSSYFVIGLILYVAAEIFNYGIELQTLSDETV